jgi:hypothetical protein
MNRTPVRSSVLISVSYDAQTSTLEMELASGGVYQYLDVPQSVVTELMNAPSLGQYYIQHIRNDYRCVKL